MSLEIQTELWRLRSILCTLKQFTFRECQENRTFQKLLFSSPLKWLFDGHFSLKVRLVSFLSNCSNFYIFFLRSAEMVFCFQNCSDPLWEKKILVIEKNFLKLLEQFIQTVKDQNNFLVTECFFNLFLEVSHIE